MKTLVYNPHTVFEKFKIDLRLEPLLLKSNQSTELGKAIVKAVKNGNTALIVKELQQQIADGGTSSVIKIIGLEAYKLIIY